MKKKVNSPADALRFARMSQALEFVGFAAMETYSSAEVRGIHFNRVGVYSEIEHLVQSCFRFGVNPLPRLREIFPRFEWNFYDLTKLTGFGKKNQPYDDALKKVISGSDMFWKAGDLYVAARAVHHTYPPRRNFGLEFPAYTLEAARSGFQNVSDWLISLGAKNIQISHCDEHQPGSRV